MATKSKYIVTISLSKSSSLVATYTAPYKEGGDDDWFHFKKTKIDIVCERSVRYQGDEPLENVQNTVYHQIKKALMVYVLTNMSNTYVRSIIVKRKTKKRTDLLASKLYSRSNQPYIKVPSGINPFPEVSASRVLQEDEMSQCLRTIVSHWMKGVATGDVFQKFDSLWRSFERSAMYSNRYEPDARKRTQERWALLTIRQKLIGHSVLYKYSKQYASGLTFNDISILRWRECLNNECARRNTRLAGCNDYRDNFILNNNDPRIVQLQRKTFPVMKKKLQAENMDAAVWNLIDTKVPTANDHELVSVLLCKYAYFYRCKVFHGEMVAQPVFMPVSVNQEEERVSLLNKLLEYTVRDFIKEFQSL